MKILFGLLTIFLFNNYAFSFTSGGVQSLYRKGFGLQVSIKSKQGLVFKEGQSVYAFRNRPRKFGDYGGAVVQCELHLENTARSNQILKKNRVINLVNLNVVDYNHSSLGYLPTREGLAGNAAGERSWEFDVSSGDRSFAKFIVKKGYSLYGYYDGLKRFIESDITISDISRLCPAFKVRKVSLNFGESL